MKKIEVQTYCGDFEFDSIREAQRFAKDLSRDKEFKGTGVGVSVGHYYRYIYDNGRAVPECKWNRFI